MSDWSRDRGAFGSEVLFDGAEMRKLVDGLDWSKTPLGPAEEWSVALKTTVSVLLANRFPSLLWWGPEYVCVYNGAYRPILGAKHPWALGRPVREVWQEIWPVLQPLIDTPFHGGPATWNDDLFLEINRRGFVEETHFTVAYSPVPDETVRGGIGGVLATVHEITDKVVADRRVAVLRDLAARTIDAKTAQEACELAAAGLAADPKDIPFALLYLVAPDQQTARLVATTGVDTGRQTVPALLPLEGTQVGASPWPFAETMRSPGLQTVTGLAGRLGGHTPVGPWSDPPHTAVVIPVRSNRPLYTEGFLVAGVSPRLALDDAYRDFLKLVCSQISTSIVSARQYEEEKKRADALAEIDRAKSLFFSNVSHEFRTPLTLMLSPLEEALSDDTPLGAVSQRERISTAHSNGLRLLKLVNNLLDFARVEAGSVSATPQPTDVAELTEDLVSVFQSAFETAGIELDTAIEPVGVLEVDVDMWEATVLNLVSNALKYTLHGSVRVELHRRDGAVELSVIDTGVGIAVEEQDRVFERFFRSSNQAGRSFEGSGIGLALVSELVKLHGGSVGVDSTPGRGSTFTVSIPARDSSEVKDGDVSRRSSAVRPRAFAADAKRWVDHPPTERVSHGDDVSRATVLVVDDNSDMRRYLRSLLGDEWRVRLASTGREALELARRDRPDLVVSDVMMPGIDGLGLVDRLRADEALGDTPVLLLSGRAGPEATVDGLGRGADDYLAKPFSAGELRARVRALLEARGRASQAAADALAWRRRAEELAQLSAALQPARTLQAIVDGTFAWLEHVVGAQVVTLSVVEGDQRMLRMYYSGTTISLPVVARHLRTPLHEQTHSGRAVRDGVSRWFEDFDSYAREFPDLAGDLKAGAVEALAVLPLRLASGAPFAALAIGWDRPQHFDTELTDTLNDLAVIVAGAAQRGQLAEVEQSAIQRLEDDLLGIDTCATGVIVRARHQGADAGINVGGDWYDAVDVGDGRVAVAVGDVVGRGLDATKIAVRLRGALGLAAFDIQGPSEALTLLDRYAKTVPGAPATTVSLAVVDPTRAVVSYACAGHPPPLLASPTGDVAYLDEGRSWPLGLDVARPRAQAGLAPFPPGSLLLLYTDGLVERRGESIDVGLGRLRQVVTDHWNLPLRRFKQAVFAHLVGHGAHDDVALVAVRGVGAGPDLFCDAFAAGRDQQPGARHRLRVWLESTGLSDEERDDIVLAVGEAVANAIDHGSDGDSSQIVTVELARRGSTLIASVGDRGHWEPGLRALLAGRGRGHLIMEALSDNVDISLDQGGTVVTLQFDHQEQLV
jgi:signal transduction histidine kinase/DNA-binding response OmpR family regulator/serine phosphatase RsbU (regulator of sigma subunit)